MNNILVINAGSSSLKYQLIDSQTDNRIATGVVERIGEPMGRAAHRWDGESLEFSQPFADHDAAFAAMLRAFTESGRPLNGADVRAVGHRVVQGGSDFNQPTLITDSVIQRIHELAELAPLHNPANLSAIMAAQEAVPGVPHVAVFDTAFHQSMPQSAYTYAIDPGVAETFGVRRYGFHGISYQVVSQRAAHFIGRPVHELKQVILHLGNGASMCAVDRGRSVNTTMGLTPLEGLVMGSRSGDIDPGALLHLLRAGVSESELDSLLNAQSGLFGLSGSQDMRDVISGIEAGNERAQLAFDVYVHQARKYLGAYLLELGGADTIVFTAGVGEHQHDVREAICAQLQWFGIELDPERNTLATSGAHCISTANSRTQILVIPTDEEGEIARQTALLVTSHG